MSKGILVFYYLAFNYRNDKYMKLKIMPSGKQSLMEKSTGRQDAGPITNMYIVVQSSIVFDFLFGYFKLLINQDISLKLQLNNYATFL